MSSVLIDVRQAARSLARQPGFVGAAVLSLALGIGVNTAIFSVLNTLLFRPLPVRDPARTVVIFHASPARPDHGTSFRAYLHYRSRADAFERVAAFAGTRPLMLTGDDRREQVYAGVVSADFFSLTSATLLMGRAFDADADRAADPPFIAVLSYAFWTRQFGSDASIVGRPLSMNDRTFTIVGVAGPGFSGFDMEAPADLWIPITAWAHVAGEPGRLPGDEHWLTTVAQIRPGVTIDRARAIAAAGAQAVHASPGQETRLRSIGEWRMGDGFSDVVTAGASALAVGLLVLTLACTNVANLLIARAAGRRREMSVRMALGGTRARIARLWLTESGLLCTGAGALSVFVAWWLLELLAAFKPPVHIGHADAPLLPFGFQIDLRVFAFTLGLASLTAASVGLVAARQASPDRARAFSPGANTRSAIIALQMALSLLLLLPCGLFVRSWMHASGIDAGFSSDGVLLLPISARQPGITIRKPPAFDEQLAARVRAIAGVQAAAVMDPVPLWFGGNTASFAIDRPSGRSSIQMGFQVVTPGYLETLQIPLRRGRDFSDADNASAPHVAIVNETMARRFWPNGDALGQRIRNRDVVIEIVGVARDAKYLTLGERPQPWLYRPLAQRGSDNPSLSLAVRTTGDPWRFRAAVEREVRALMPNWPSFQFRTLDEGLQLQRALPRAAATVLGILGFFGLTLAMVGVYGVMAYVARQRRREIGLRLALGSTRRAAVAVIVRQGMWVCAVGAVVGFAMALAGTRLLQGVLYGIDAADPLTYATVPVLLLSIALIACWVPVYRTTRQSVLQMLGDES